MLAGWGLVSLFPAPCPRASISAGPPTGYAADWSPAAPSTAARPCALFFLLGLFGALALLNAATVLFRSQRLEAALHGDEEDRIRALLKAYGGQDSLGYFATRRDKAVVFSPSGKAAVTYRVEAGVCLASGDPVGDREAWPHAIAAWLDLARRHAWAPAVMGASEDGARAFARAGLGALQLGDEAILHVADFDLAGRDMRVTRQAVGRVQRAGATCRIRRHATLSDAEMEEVVDRADAWRDTETERGFSMALDRLGDPADGDCLLVEALGEDGKLLALLSLVPWGGDGVSLDLMRRDRTAPNGVDGVHGRRTLRHRTEAGRPPDLLNFAVFRSAFEEGARIGAGPVLRRCGAACCCSSPSGGSWRPFTAQRQVPPRVVPPLHLLRRETASLARISLASGIAEGFVSVPSLRQLWGKGHPKSGRPGDHRGAAVPVRRSASPEGTRPGPDGPDSGLPEQVRVRHRTLDRLIATGTDPYPVGVPQRTHTLAEIRAGTKSPSPGG
ncbi:phosphatidylglycerol lysyltransferase domain-containing protein [Streptomyces sp. L7]